MKPKYPPYTHGFIDRTGTPRFYLRMPGRKRVPLPGLPWSPEFMAAREAAMAGDEWHAPPIGSTATVAGTVNAALVVYYESGVWQALNESTRWARRSVLEKFRGEHGDKRLALMHAHALAAILDRKTPAAQRNFRKAVRGLVNFAIDRGLIETDPFAAVRLAKQKKKGEFDGIIPWMPEECAQFEAHFQLGTRERSAYELLLQGGQSKCDIIRMGRQHVRNGMIAMRRKKTGVPFYVPVTAELQAAIDAIPPSDHLTFIVTEHGKPYTADGFGRWFRKACDKAGLPRKDKETGKSRCTPHGLRKAAAVRLAQRGATTTQFMAWFGWKTSTEADRYTQAVEREQAALMAAEVLKARTPIDKSAPSFAKASDNPLK